MSTLKNQLFKEGLIGKEELKRGGFQSNVETFIANDRVTRKDPDDYFTKSVCVDHRGLGPFVVVEAIPVSVECDCGSRDPERFHFPICATKQRNEVGHHQTLIITTLDGAVITDLEGKPQTFSGQWFRKD